MSAHPKERGCLMAAVANSEARKCLHMQSDGKLSISNKRYTQAWRRIWRRSGDADYVVRY